VDRFLPYRNVLLKYEPKQKSEEIPLVDRPVFDEYKLFLEEEIEKIYRNPIIKDPKWLSAPSFLLTSFAMYFHDTGQYASEREVLEIINNLLGKKHYADWNLKKLENLILDNDLEGAELVMDNMHQNFSGQYFTFLGQGLIQKSKGEFKASLESFRKAADMRPLEFRPHFEMAILYWSIEDAGNAEFELSEAKKRMINLRQLRMVQKAVVS
jgi:hypothetical protein